MTVKELIEKLKEFKEEEEVYIESSGDEYYPQPIERVSKMKHSFSSSLRQGLPERFIESVVIDSNLDKNNEKTQSSS